MPATATKRLTDLVKAVKCSAEYGRTLRPWDQYDEWQKKAHPYRVTLRYKRRRLSVDFWMGEAHTKEPDAEGVMECLLSDAHAGDASFEDFCAEMGYDTDSRQAERTWKACERMNGKLRRFLGDDFEAFMYADRN